MTITHIPLTVLLLALALSVAAESSHKRSPRIKAAIIPRRPFGDAEKAIMLAFGQKYGLEIDFVFVRSAIQAAELVINGSVEVASAGIMTSYFSGRGRCWLFSPYGPSSHGHYLAVGYSVYACEITLHLVVPKREYAKPYYNLIKPLSSIVWAVTIGSIFTVLMVRLRHSLQCKWELPKHSEFQAASVFARLLKANVGDFNLEMIAIIFSQGGEENVIN